MKSQISYLSKLELFKNLDNFRDGNFFAVADQRLKNHLPQWILFSPHVFWLKSPEEERTLEVYERACQFLLKQGIQASSPLYAFGGGATTDFTGFIAATLLRGLKWSAVPSTLYGMVGGSIGGQVALNMPQGKNLLGARHVPETIFLCSDFLTTLENRDWVSGKSEMLKYGFLSKDIQALILKRAPIGEIAFECAKFKSNQIESERAYLNLGDVFGRHLAESLQVSDGLGSGLGLACLFKTLGSDENLTALENMMRALSLPLDQFDLNRFENFNPKSFLQFLENEGRKSGGKIELVMVKTVGSCYVDEVSLRDLLSKVKLFIERKIVQAS